MDFEVNDRVRNISNRAVTGTVVREEHGHVLVNLDHAWFRTCDVERIVAVPDSYRLHASLSWENAISDALHARSSAVAWEKSVADSLERNVTGKEAT